MLQNSSVRCLVADLARQHNIVYVKTRGDEWADSVTQLLGDDVTNDDTRNILVALKRAGVLTGREMSDLLAKHLCEVFQR